jgi:hypothetical protein
VHYRTKSNQPKVEASGPVDSDSPSATNVFCSNGAGFDKIYKLVSPGKNLYLCLGSGISCNTCIYSIASVVELTNDGINFRYPAFQTNPMVFIQKTTTSPALYWAPGFMILKTSASMKKRKPCTWFIEPMTIPRIRPEQKKGSALCAT